MVTIQARHKNFIPLWYKLKKNIDFQTPGLQRHCFKVVFDVKLELN